MKKLLLSAALTAAFTMPVHPAPFLVCDPYPTTADQAFTFTVAGLTATPLTVVAQTNADGSTQLHMDLTALNLAAGTYTVTATAVDVFGTPSAPSTLTFIKGTPGNPGHVRVSPN